MSRSKTNDKLLWAFRVASRPEVGGGHVARCLTLAGEVVKLGDKVVFVLDDDGLGWQREIAGRGYDCMAASSALNEKTDGCVLDAYALDQQTIKSWRERAATMVAIVDHQLPPDWADLIIAPAMPPCGVKVPMQVILAGLEYALVDPRFFQTTPRTIPERVRNVLVSFGQRDSRNATGLALKALEQLPEVREKSVTVTAAVGKFSPHLRSIKDQVEKIEGANCAIDADMTRCYAQADLAIGAGGVGLFERMAQGLPSVSVIIAENQRQSVALCANIGGTIDAGSFENLTVTELATTVSSLLRSRERRAAMSARGHAAVDGLGAKRCAREMRNLLELAG